MCSMQVESTAFFFPLRLLSRQMAAITRARVAAKDLRSPIFQAGGRVLAASRSACLLYVRLWACLRIALEMRITFIVFGLCPLPVSSRGGLFFSRLGPIKKISIFAILVREFFRK